MNKQFEARLQAINMGINNAKDLPGIIIILLDINNPILLNSINGDLLIEKIIELRKKVSNEEFSGCAIDYQIYNIINHTFKLNYII